MSKAMTCNCISLLAAAIREDKAQYPHAEGVMLLNRIADRLSPPPVAPVPELAGWWCEVWGSDGGWIVSRYHGDRIDWLDVASGRFVSNTSKHGSGWAKFPTQAAAEAAIPAAVAALNAASEPPGVVEDKVAFVSGLQHLCPDCGKPSDRKPGLACDACLQKAVDTISAIPHYPGTANTRPYVAVVADGKAVPAGGFDAEAMAEAMFKHNNAGRAKGSVNISHYDNMRGWSVLLRDDDRVGDTIVHWKEMIREAISAAHAAGAASAKPRLRYEVLNSQKEPIAAFRDHYPATLFCGGTNGWTVVDTQPAAPADAKEAAQ